MEGYVCENRLTVALRNQLNTGWFSFNLRLANARPLSRVKVVLWTGWPPSCRCCNNRAHYFENYQPKTTCRLFSQTLPSGALFSLSLSLSLSLFLSFSLSLSLSLSLSPSLSLFFFFSTTFFSSLLLFFVLRPKISASFGSLQNDRVESTTALEK